MTSCATDEVVYIHVHDIIYGNPVTYIIIIAAYLHTYGILLYMVINYNYIFRRLHFSSSVKFSVGNLRFRHFIS